MKYHQIKTKIDKVMESCNSTGQFNMATEWCRMLIDKYIPRTIYDNITLRWYLEYWDSSCPQPPCPPPTTEWWG